MDLIYERPSTDNREVFEWEPPAHRTGNRKRLVLVVQHVNDRDRLTTTGQHHCDVDQRPADDAGVRLYEVIGPLPRGRVRDPTGRPGPKAGS